MNVPFIRAISQDIYIHDVICTHMEQKHMRVVYAMFNGEPHTTAGHCPH